jgi:hypothetical protein
LRDAVLKSWEPKRLDLSRRPPAIEVTLDVEAVTYVVTIGTSDRFGNEKDARRTTLKWTLELTDSKRVPWQLTTSSSPAEEIPGWS